MSPIPNGAITRSLADVLRRLAPLAMFEPPGTFLLNVLAGIALFVAGCQSFQKQTAQRSAKCGAMCAKAREARENGNSDLANRCIDEAVRQRPSDLETRRQLAETMWNTGRRTEAVAVFVSLSEQQPRDANLASRLAVMQWQLEQHAAAAKTATAVLNLDPQNKDAWRIKARSEVEQGQLEEALVSYNQLSQLAPDDLPTLIELGELHLQRGHPDRACPLFQAAVQHPQATKAQRADSEWLLGVAYARSRRWSLAVSVLESAVTRRASTADDWCFLGWNRLQCGDLSGAQADLQTALKRDPNSQATQLLAQQLASFQKQSNAVIPTAYREPSNDESLKTRQ